MTPIKIRREAGKGGSNERLRSEDLAAPPSASWLANANETLPETVWLRIEKFQGEQFHTATRLPFTFEVDGNGIWVVGLFEIDPLPEFGSSGMGSVSIGS
jgi:hypothetical protein